MNGSFMRSAAIILLLIPAMPAQGQACNPLPAEFDNNRIFLTPTLEGGDTLSFYTDTGGGFNAINKKAVERHDWKIRKVRQHGRQASVVEMPSFRKGKGIPDPLPEFLDGRLVVTGGERLERDGFLGGRWFGDRIWKIDYPKKSLCRYIESPEVPADHPHRVKLGFATDADGERTMHFPGFEVEIDGKTHVMLLDTGANGRLSGEAAEVAGLDGKPRVGLNFIAASVFDKWAENHPDWAVIEGGVADRDRPLMRVPEITLAGHTVGPVWFERQPDGLRDKLGPFMDRRPDGAIGGDTFRFFRVILNYPESYAVFERPAE